MRGIWRSSLGSVRMYAPSILHFVAVVTHNYFRIDWKIVVSITNFTSLLSINLTAIDLIEIHTQPSEMNYWSLKEFISKLKSNGFKFLKADGAYYPFSENPKYYDFNIWLGWELFFS